MLNTSIATPVKLHTTLEEFSDKVEKVARYHKYAKELGSYESKVQLLTSKIFTGKHLTRYSKWVGKDIHGEMYLKTQSQYGDVGGDDLTQDEYNLILDEQEKGLLKIKEIIEGDA